MGTSAKLVFQNQDGKIYITTINFDGDSVMGVLNKCVNTYEKVSALLTKYVYLRSIDCGKNGVVINDSSPSFRVNGPDYHNIEGYNSGLSHWDDYIYFYSHDTKKWA